MTITEFKATLSSRMPPDTLTPVLRSLWFAGKNDWERAHDIAQDIHSSEGSWVHAYLHRVEGDPGNAAYWYRQAGKPVPSVTTEVEWEQMVTTLL
ncbi:MAG: hypothetical protein EOO02_14375 [Chitinophagaceae bacterium]|nr:MAG: hypothetical protein EOO02_14375 [Chitinophagaceae bacterium]